MLYRLLYSGGQPNLKDGPTDAINRVRSKELSANGATCGVNGDCYAEFSNNGNTVLQW